MTAGAFDFTIEAGATLRLTFQCFDPDGNVFDLSSYSARAHVRNGEELILDLAPIVSEPANGKIKIIVPSALTSTLSGWTVAEWNLELYTFDDTDVIRALEGRVTLSEDQTL